MPRAWLLPSLAILALAAVGPMPALAGAPVTEHAVSPKILRPDPVPEPRVQLPGQTSGYRLPILAGQEFRIEQGWNSTFSHYGKNAYAYDIGMPLGTKVLAAAGGLVAFTHDGETACGGKDLLKKANYVTIYHADGSASLYAHLSTVAVKVGEIVAAGQVIGTSGNTGYTQCVPHLHFARQYQGASVSQSVPVYFQGYEKQQFHTGDVISVPAPACAAPAADPTVIPGTATATQAGADAPSAAAQVAGRQGAAKTDGTRPLLASGAEAAAPREGARQPVTATQPGDDVRPDLGTFCGAYYGGGLDQPAAFLRSDALLNFDWRQKGPGGYWLDDARAPFAARWTGDFAFASAGTYTIGVIWAGGVTVSIDGVPVVDGTTDPGGSTETLLSRVLGAGIHRVDVDYLAADGHGMLKVGWGRLLADG